ncbi:MAG: AAA family ATPase [Proteobacteria bacterium]|nr:AAA family ATPase [Pseudomonadota bacterium]
MTNKNVQDGFHFSTPELTHRIELILHLLEYSNHLIIVKGEYESGKTTLCQQLTDKQETNLIIRRLSVHSDLSTADFFHALINDAESDKTCTQSEFNDWLVRCQNKQQIPCLLIDNIDLLNDEQLNEFFHLILQTNVVAVLHTCIFCEPAFVDRLENADIIKDETQSLHIIEMPTLTEKQTEQYIHSKYPEDDTTAELSLFDDRTVKQIHRISHGLPGRINALCEQYLDDPAKQTIVKERPRLKLPVVGLKQNKSVLLAVVLLACLSVGIVTLSYTEDETEEKQTIKLNLPNQTETDVAQQAGQETETMQALEPEPVTIEELPPPVIPEMADDTNGKSGVVVYNATGEVVAGESEVETIETTVPETIVAGSELSNTKVIDSTVAGPEPIDTSETQDINWLVQQDPKHYVLQLIGAYEKKTIDFYLKSFKDNEDKIIFFTASNKGREWYVLVYGYYQTRDQAVAAIEELSDRARQMAPWPRTVGSIKQLLQQSD